MTARDRDRATGEPVIREGDVVVDEGMNRREGFVEYEGTTERGDTVVDRDTETHGPGAMQAGATVFAGSASEADRSIRAETSGIPDMSTDNTIPGMGQDGPLTRLLAQIREGMTVVDATGEEVGTVEYVKMGDPQAATTEGAVADRDNTLIEDAARAFGADAEPDVPEPFRSELLREGFVKVDGPGWFGADRYLRAVDISDVTMDTVRLRVAKEALPSDQV